MSAHSSPAGASGPVVPMQALLPSAHPRTDHDLVQALRDAGIVGAGGAGFPTYVKYARPTPILLVNGAESEPGYVTDKLLLKERASEFAKLFVLLRDVEAYERIIVGVEESAKPYLGRLERLADSTDAFEVAYFENLYRYGQERALIKRLLLLDVPPKQPPPSIGVTVNNVETMWNIRRALFEGHPVTTKLVVVFGETPHHLAAEVPVGAFATDLLALAGFEGVGEGLRLYDGGPVLCEDVPEWQTRPYGVRRNTNGLLLVAPERLKSRARAYPRPEGPRPPTHIEYLERLVERVRIPLGGKYNAPARPIVSPGDEVAAGDLIALAQPARLSVPAHASIDGIVTQATPDHIEIRRPDPEAWWL